MTTALIIRNDSELTVRISEEAERLKAEALEKSGVIGRVSNDEEQEAAVEAQMACERIIKLTEDSRKAVKAPVIDLGRDIDGKAKRFVEDLVAEKLRLGKLAGDYVTLQEAKARAAEAQRLKELDGIEQERQKQRAEATSHDDLDRADYEAAQKQAAIAPVEVTRAEGQSVRKEWEITVEDVHRLYFHHRQCVSLEPKKSEIKLLLDHWVTLGPESFRDRCREAGIKAERVTKSGVRLGKEKGMIEA